MTRAILLGAVVATVMLGDAVPSWAHAGSSTPVPRGCHIVVESVAIDGVDIKLRRLSCPPPKDPATS